MTQILIKELFGADRIAQTQFLTQYAFGPSPPIRPDPATREKELAHTRCFVLYEDGQIMASSYDTHMSQVIRAKYFPMSGVAGVATHPAARRKGYAFRLLHHQFQQVMEEGKVVSTLYPFKASFYARLGYVNFPMVCTYEFSPHGLSGLRKVALKGAVKLVSMDKGYAQYCAYLKAYQQGRHGMALSQNGWPDSRQFFPNKYWLAFAQNEAGEIQGAMVYQIDRNMGNMIVKRMVYTSVLGRYLLLDWMGRHSGQVSRIHLTLAAFEQPALWVDNLLINPKAQGMPMARVLKVAGLSGMQVGAGQFEAKIQDQNCPWNEGSFRFSEQDGLLVVEQINKAAELLDIRALTALVYGTHDPAEFEFRDWGTPSPEVIRNMRSMFSRQMPDLYEKF